MLCPAFGINTFLAPGTCAASAFKIFRSNPVVSPPPMKRVGEEIAAASLLVNGRRPSFSCAKSVKALSSRICRSAGGNLAQLPCPLTPSTNALTPPSKSPSRSKVAAVRAYALGPSSAPIEFA